jgi:hypothetical protein
MKFFLCLNFLTFVNVCDSFFCKLQHIYRINDFCAPNSWWLQAEEMSLEETAVEEPAAVVEEEAAVDPPPEAVVILDPSPAAQEGSKSTAVLEFLNNLEPRRNRVVVPARQAI